MDLLVEKLEAFSLQRFVNDNRLTLCRRTVNQSQVAAFLKFDADQIEKISTSLTNYSKNEKLYQLIETTVAVKDFLEALKETGNEHISKFIESADFSTSAQIPSTSANQHPNLNPSRGIWFNIPEPIDSFCGRKDFLSQLHDKLQNQHLVNSTAVEVAGSSRAKAKSKSTTSTSVTVLSQVKIVSGLGGIGKTETATQYIWSHQKSYNNLIWINAESENSMRNSFLKLASELEISVKNPEGKSREIEEIVKKIYSKICDDGKSNLIVFDNAEDYQSCKKFFPFGLHPDLKKPVILATSRNQEWISRTGKITVLPLDVLTESESLEFILTQLEIPGSPEFREESKEFIELIGGLPLALQQAVAYIKNEKELQKFHGKSYQITDYVQEFKSSMKKLQKFPPNPESWSTVYVTWNVTLLKFFGLKDGEKTIQILTNLSFLYADKIPSSFLRSLVPEIGDEKFSGALKLLEKYSLVKLNVDNFCLSIHRQLQFVILQYLQESNDILKVVINLVDKCKVVLENIEISAPESSDIFLNLHQIANNPFDLIPRTEKFPDFMSVFGSVLYKASRHIESLDLYQKAYNNLKDLLGENDQNTLTTQNNIAHVLHELGRYDEALILYRKVLEREKINLGLNDPKTLSTLHQIGEVLLQQKKCDLELLQQVLAQKIKVHGENHRDTLLTLNSIALFHVNRGNFSEALALFEDIEKKLEILGADDVAVLITKHNKAGVLFAMGGKFQEASGIVNEIYEKKKKIRGENHLDTILTLSWIAQILEHQGNFEEALEHYKTVYKVRKESLGDNHPDTINVKSKITTLRAK